MKFMNMVLVVLAAMVSGCTINVPQYGISQQNVEEIKKSGIKPVAVAQFKSTKPGLVSITCRAVGPVTVAPSFEGYIEHAFVEELTKAGFYDPASKITISGVLEHVDFSSGMTDGNWTLVLTVSNDKQESFTTTSKIEFSGSFLGDAACRDVANAFIPAVQRLIGDVVRNPKFKQVAG